MANLRKYRFHAVSLFEFPGTVYEASRSGLARLLTVPKFAFLSLPYPLSARSAFLALFILFSYGAIEPRMAFPDPHPPPELRRLLPNPLPP